MNNVEQLFRQLLRESPSFHGDTGQSQWSLAPEVMEWLFHTVQEGQRTLETGCGYSTLIFALKGAHHTVISPMAQEHERIQAWGEAHGVDFSTVTFRTEKSENVLPKLSDEKLDLVLIDGWHAFPAPFIDWFYTCQRLKVGGRMIVDDTQIRACRILCDFLSEEKGRWVVERRFHRTDVFCKENDEVFQGDWRSQPYGAAPILSLQDHWKASVRPRLVKLARCVPGLMFALKRLRSFASGNVDEGGGKRGE